MEPTLETSFLSLFLLRWCHLKLPMYCHCLCTYQTPKPSDDDDEDEDLHAVVHNNAYRPPLLMAVPTLSSTEDGEIIKSVVDRILPSYSLKSWLREWKRAAVIQGEALQRMTGRMMAIWCEALRRISGDGVTKCQLDTCRFRWGLQGHCCLIGSSSPFRF